MQKKKKIILSAKKESFWLDVFYQLKKNGFTVPYWIGANASVVVPEDCFFHEAVDAYELKNLYITNRKVFSLSKLTLEEYYNYLKILDRADNIGGYSFSQRDRLFKEQLNYWYSVLLEVNPGLVVFSNLPHLLYDYPLYLVAKSLGIKTLIFNVTPFKGWHYVTESLSSSVANNLVKHSLNNELICAEFKKIAVGPYAGQSYIVPYYMVKQIEHDQKNKYLLLAKNIVKSTLSRIGMYSKKPLMRNSWQRNCFDFFGVKKSILGTELYYNIVLNQFKSKLRNKYERTVVRLDDIDKASGYVYVPLHYQPEATTAPSGGVYSDQIFMLETLRESLPPDVAIIVKEHYSQFSDALSGFRGRYLDYWDRISRIDNTYVVSFDEEPKSLILNSLAVATVTGTSGWEAIQYGKHCIVFGEPWYSSYPGLIKYDNKFNESVKTIMLGKEPVNHIDEFLQNFCKSLINVDIHNYSEGEVSRSPVVIVNTIKNYLKIKTKTHL